MIKLLLQLVKLLPFLFPLLKKISLFLGFIWRWIRKIAVSPFLIIAYALIEPIDALCAIFLGKSIGVSFVYNWASSTILNEMVKHIPDIPLNGALENLPELGIELASYFGVLSAIQILMNGIASAFATMLTFKLSFLLLKMKLAAASRKFSTHNFPRGV